MNAGNQNTNMGRWLLLLTALMWSTSGYFAKAPWLQAWPIETRGVLLAFWRTFFAGFCLLPLARERKWTWRLIPTTLIFAAMNVTYLSAMTQTTAANAIWLQNTAPIWVVLFGVFFQNADIKRHERIMLILGTVGIIFILAFELLNTEAGSRGGLFWGVAGGLTYAAVIITVSWLKDLDSAWVIAMNHLVTAALLSPVVVSIGIVPELPQLLWLAGFGIFQLGVPYWLFARALKTVPQHEASFMVLLEPILVPIWVYLAYHNHESYVAPRWWTIVGATFILAGLSARLWKRNLATSVDVT